MNKNVVSLAHSCAKGIASVCFCVSFFFLVVVVVFVVGSFAFIFAVRCNSVEHINASHVFVSFAFGKSCLLFLQFNALSFNTQWKNTWIKYINFKIFIITFRTLWSIIGRNANHLWAKFTSAQYWPWTRRANCPIITHNGTMHTEQYARELIVLRNRVKNSSWENELSCFWWFWVDNNSTDSWLFDIFSNAADCQSKIVYKIEFANKFCSFGHFHRQ